MKHVAISMEIGTHSVNPAFDGTPLFRGELAADEWKKLLLRTRKA